jgi:3-hydroxyacyl-CoA dehydrogenase
MIASDVDSFYEYENGVKHRVYNPIKCEYEEIYKPDKLILLAERRAAGKVLKENSGASLLDLDDGVLCEPYQG